MLYNYEQVKDGFHGLLNDSQTDKLGLASIYGFFSAKITGTSAKVLGRDFDNMLEVSVDGGAYTIAPNVAGVHTLFDGLADIEHDVTFRQRDGFGLNNGWIVKNGAYCIDVAGASTSIQTLSHRYTFHSPALVSSAITVPVGSPDFNAEFYRNRLAGTNISMSNVMFRTSATEILVCFHTYTPSAIFLFYSIDGGPAQSIEVGQDKVVRLTTSGEHTYNMWAGTIGTPSSQSDISSLQANSDLIRVGSRLDQFGDSITEGVTSSSNPDVEIHEVAAHFGRLGQTYGRSGATISDLLAGIPNYNIENLIDPDDIAILAIGRNSLTIDTDPVLQSEYNDIITALLTLGYKKVMCRGILPELQSQRPYTDQNATIEGIVTAYNDDRVGYIDVAGWINIELSDGTHPTPTGYQQMIDYAKVSYASFLSVINSVYSTPVSIELGNTYTASARYQNTITAGSSNTSLSIKFDNNDEIVLIDTATNTSATSLSTEFVALSGRTTASIHLQAETSSDFEGDARIANVKLIKHN